MLNENQIGTYDNEGKRVWPDLDFFGQRFYQGAVSTMGLGKDRFVVLPANFEKRPGAQEKLAAVREESRAKAQKPIVRPPTKKASDE